MSLKFFVIHTQEYKVLEMQTGVSTSVTFQKYLLIF